MSRRAWCWGGEGVAAVTAAVAADAAAAAFEPFPVVEGGM